VRCNAICPGNVKGERINRVIQSEADLRGVPFDVVAQESVGGQSIARFVDPQEVADLCIYLSGDKARMINGEAIAIDGHAETFHIK
jgi:NAD(P)-dependent dehydrogenase (short-subunit alcohol dehydrogenase family)